MECLDGEKMKKIKELFEELSIPEDDYPDYSDPTSFAKNFKRCSILEDHFIMESSSSYLSGATK
mgnify:CR=1 FL=1